MVLIYEFFLFRKSCGSPFSCMNHLQSKTCLWALQLEGFLPHDRGGNLFVVAEMEERFVCLTLHVCYRHVCCAVYLHFPQKCVKLDMYL